MNQLHQESQFVWLSNRMSISSVIDERYRLHPRDLGRSSIQVTIQNVSWQGVEQLNPLLHLREFPQKRLLLNQRQMQRLLEITGSTLERDWIGHTLQLRSEYDDGELIIALYPMATTREYFAPHRPILQLHETTRTLFLLAILGLLFVLVFLLENSTTFWQFF